MEPNSISFSEVKAQSDRSENMEILSKVDERYEPLVLSEESMTCLERDTALERGLLCLKYSMSSLQSSSVEVATFIRE